MASIHPEPYEETTKDVDISTIHCNKAGETLENGVIGEDTTPQPIPEPLENSRADEVKPKEEVQPIQETNTKKGGAEGNSVRPSKTGQKVFKKTCPNGKITVYVGHRDFLDTGDVVEDVEGVVLVDEEYLKKDGENDAKKVFCQLEGAFRYGKEELEAIGISFEKSLYKDTIQVSIVLVLSHSICVYGNHNSNSIVRVPNI